MTTNISFNEVELTNLIKKIVLECLNELPPAEEEKLLTSKSAADFLGIKVQTLYNYRSAKKIKPQKMIGNSPRYSKEYLAKIQI